MSETPLSIQGITAVAVVAYGKQEVVLATSGWPPDRVGESSSYVEP